MAEAVSKHAALPKAEAHCSFLRPFLARRLADAGLYGLCRRRFWCCIQPEPQAWSLLSLLPLVYWLGSYVSGLLHGGRKAFWLIQAALSAVVGPCLVFGRATRRCSSATPNTFRLFCLLQEAVILWLVIVVFARPAARKIPLCSALAVLVHPVMTPEVWRYTRTVTGAWALWIAALWLGISGPGSSWRLPLWALFSP